MRSPSAVGIRLNGTFQYWVGSNSDGEKDGSTKRCTVLPIGN